MQYVCLFYASKFSSRIKVTIIQTEFNALHQQESEVYTTHGIMKLVETSWPGETAWAMEHCIIVITTREPLM